MNGLTLFALVFGPIIGFSWGDHFGYSRGYVEGRKAVRKYYEKVSR